MQPPFIGSQLANSLVINSVAVSFCQTNGYLLDDSAT